MNEKEGNTIKEEVGKGIKYKPLYMTSGWQPYQLWFRTITFFVLQLEVQLDYPFKQCDLHANIILLEASTTGAVPYYFLLIGILIVARIKCMSNNLSYCQLCLIHFSHSKCYKGKENKTKEQKLKRTKNKVKRGRKEREKLLQNAHPNYHPRTNQELSHSPLSLP